MKIVFTLALVGLGVGIVGGLIGADAWLRGVEAVFLVGLVVIFLYAWWRRPKSMMDLDAEAPANEPPCINVPRAEQELQRKDRGTVPIEE